LAAAQDLAPRAYLITPLHANAVTLTWSFYSGGFDFNGTVPITGATGTYSVPVFSYYHSLSFFGRSANVTVSLPYGVGTFTGDVLGQDVSVYRSGLLDLSARFSVNLKGGPAMAPKEFVKWKQKTIIGASLKIVAPTGQYDPNRIVNWGINRWAFKPELGYSRRWRHWLLDGYGGVWFYTTNAASYSIPIPQQQTEEPIGSFEGHLSHDFKARAWVSLDGNFWWGGVTALNGIRNLATKQTGSRIGGTVSLPITKHQSIKIAYSNGTYIRFGGNYQNVQVAWQYSWIGSPK
jgi:outer membrane putative beta-barrel porin/alpha-amylase